MADQVLIQYLGEDSFALSLGNYPILLNGGDRLADSPSSGLLRIQSDLESRHYKAGDLARAAERREHWVIPSYLFPHHQKENILSLHAYDRELIPLYRGKDPGRFLESGLWPVFYQEIAVHSVYHRYWGPFFWIDSPYASVFYAPFPPKKLPAQWDTHEDTLRLLEELPVDIAFIPLAHPRFFDLVEWIEPQVVYPLGHASKLQDFDFSSLREDFPNVEFRLMKTPGRLEIIDLV